MSLNRPFDNPEQYEREKVTRIMPADLRKMGYYTLRVMMPPSSPVFAVEYTTYITDVEPSEISADGLDVGYVFQPGRESKKLDHNWSWFNRNGYMAFINVGEGAYKGFPEEVEFGYFVGSTDPFDVELAELVAKAQEPHLIV